MSLSLNLEIFIETCRND